MKIPLYKPDITWADRQAVLRVLESGWISHRGPAVARFEAAFARAVGAPYAVAVSSGTAALHCALVAAGVEPGDQVIVPSLTYVATVNAVRHCGAEPVFRDVDEKTWTMLDGPQDTHWKVPVHLYGHPALHEGRIVEDCAEALGSRLAGIGATAAWSFFANKTITCGEGGMVTTQDAAVAAMVYEMSHQGQARDEAGYAMAPGGYNYRMTAMQAALGLSQLRRLRTVTAKKRRIAGWYKEGLRGLPVTLQADHPQHAWWLVSARVRERDALRGWLQQHGIETRPVFPAMGDTPVAHMIAGEGISFPSWPGLTRAQVGRVCGEVRRFYR